MGETSALDYKAVNYANSLIANKVKIFGDAGNTIFGDKIRGLS